MKKKTGFTKRLFSTALSIAMLLSTMPLTTNAAASSACPDHAGWTAITAADPSDKTGGNFYIAKDITNNNNAWSALTLITNNSNICLNGKTMNTTTSSPALSLKGISANIYDCTGSGTLKSSNRYGYALRAYQSTANLYGIQVIGSSYYPAIWAYGDSTVNLYGCTVEGSVATYGGIVRIENSIITGNGGRYAAVEASGSNALNLTVSGNTKISGTNGGLKLRANETINVDGLTSGAEIHVTSTSDADLIPVTGSNDTDISAYFHSEKDHYKIINGENNVVYLAINHAYSDATCVAPPTCSCGKINGEIDPNQHNISSEWTTEEGKHYKTCLNDCGQIFDEDTCSGGTDTCTVAAVCATCQVSYGTVLGHDPIYTLDADDSGKLVETCSRCDHNATASLSVENNSFTYTGQAFTPVDISYSENWLGTNMPTDIGYEKNTNAGTAAAKITVEGQELIKTFTITPKALTADMATIDPPSGTYNGPDNAEPTVTLNFNGKELVKDTDYTTVGWVGDFAVAGDKTITMNGMGNFSETITLTYNISKGTATAELFKAVLPENAVYDGITAYHAEITLADHVVGVGDITVKYNGSTDAPVNAGTYTVTVDTADGENYNAAANIRLGSFTVAKGIPNIGTVTAELPDDTLNISQLTIFRSDETVAGTLRVDPGQRLVLGDNTIRYTFTPADSSNYNVLRDTVTVTATDTIAPVITGVNDGASYCTRQTVRVTDKNLHTVTLNGETVGQTITLKDDEEAIYTIVATDNAGNQTTVTVQMIPVEAITDSLDNLDSSNVTSDDKPELQTILDNVTELLENKDLTPKDRDTLRKAKNEAEALIGVIEDTAAEQEAVTDRAESLEEETLQPDNKEDLTQLAGEIETLLDTENLTEEERAALETVLEQVEGMIDAIEDTEKEPEEVPEIEPEVVTYTWEKDSIGWYYLGSDGTVATSCWLTDSKGWCYVGADGYCETNCWKQNDCGWMYLDSEGSMTKNTWIGSYYLGADGYMVTNNWVYDGIGWCYVDDSGVALRSRWIYVDGYWYYLESDGYRISNIWWKDSVGWCYLDDNGAMLTNCWKQDSKGWCYIGADGYCETNCWKQDNVGWMYLDDEGSMTKRTWIEDCYLGADGYMVTNNWVHDGIGRCYVGSAGYRETNCWKQDSKGWCYIGADGYCETNCWKQDGEGWLYLDEKGYATKQEWIQYKDSWYYLDEDGYMVTGTHTIDDVEYNFDESGVWIP